MKDKLTLVGFPGSGKTAVAESLAVNFGIVGVDLDTAIEERTGKRVPDIIRVEGEDAFRASEEQVLASLLNERDDIQLVALGGGALLSAENRELVRTKSFCVELKAPDEVLVERVLSAERAAQSEGCGPQRPVLIRDHSRLSEETVLDAVRELKNARCGLYDSADCVVWTHAASVEDTAAAVHAEWNLARSPKTDRRSCVPVGIQPKVISQQLVAGENALPSLGGRIRQAYPSASKVALVIDENVQALWGEAVLESLSGWDVSVHPVPSGENSKCFRELERLADELLEAGLSRRDVVAACGGGVVGDLAGFLASTFMRGVGLIHVPTTLIAQVDSAIGGKTGVNLQGGKNLVGTFNPAPLTLNDPAFLTTLPEREFRAGLAEVIKYGFIQSAWFYDWLRSRREEITSRNLDSLREVIDFCSRAKLEIVAMDLEDRLGKRALLNFGHTLGHAVESLAGYGTYLHGEAVSIGMVFALAFGAKLGLSRPELAGEAADMLRSFNLPVDIPEDLVKPEALDVWGEALRADKKKVSDAIEYVIVKEIGVATTHTVEMETVVEFIKEYAAAG